MNTIDELVENLTSLPQNLKIVLTERLLASMDYDPEIREEEEWLKISETRLREIKNDPSMAISTDEVLKTLRSRLKNEIPLSS
jgi:hypothetical protein